MSQWALITLLDVQKTLAYLAYLGYNISENENQLSGVLGNSDFYKLFSFVH